MTNPIFYKKAKKKKKKKKNNYKITSAEFFTKHETDSGNNIVMRMH